MRVPGVRYRLILFLLGGAGLGALLIWAVTGLPEFGDYSGSYGLILNEVVASERHVANLVSAVNYDYRALDTLGEEFILLTAVTGVVLLLRLAREERGERIPAPWEVDDLLRATGPTLVALTLLFGLYIVAHGQLTPGGGFQGGVIIATGVLLLFLVGGYSAFRRIALRSGVEALEAIGTGGYIVVGLFGLILGGSFLENFLPLGEFRALLSGGTVPLISLLVGCAVAGGFTSIYLEFLEIAVETRMTEPRSEDDGRRPTEGGER